MKMVLHFPDMASAAEEIVVEWINELVSQKGTDNPSPLRYVNRVEVINAAPEKAESPATPSNSAMVPCQECCDIASNSLWNKFWSFCPWCGHRVAQHQ